MIGYLTTEEKAECRRLWEAAFPEDSKSFDDYYFTEKIKGNRILAWREDGQIGSMVHMNPYQISVRGNIWNSDYIVGVATAEDKRRRGYMRQLLVRMLRDQMEEEMPFCFLMPADEAIYRPFDFTYIFNQPVWVLRPEYAGPNGLERRRLIPWQDSACGRSYLAGIADWMNRWLENRYQVYARRDEQYMQQLLKEIASENGTFDMLYDRGTMVGVHSEWGLGEREQRMLLCEPQYVGEISEKPAIMARIVCLKKFVQAVRLSRAAAGQQAETVIKLMVTDELLAENHGCWDWHLNQYTSWLEMAEDGEADLTLSISELTGWLFGYQMPAAAVRYQDVVETLRGVFLDEVV